MMLPSAENCALSSRHMAVVSRGRSVISALTFCEDRLTGETNWLARLLLTGENRRRLTASWQTSRENYCLNVVREAARQLKEREREVLEELYARNRNKCQSDVITTTTTPEAIPADFPEIISTPSSATSTITTPTTTLRNKRQQSEDIEVVKLREVKRKKDNDCLTPSTADTPDDQETSTSEDFSPNDGSENDCVEKSLFFESFKRETLKHVDNRLIDSFIFPAMPNCEPTPPTDPKIGTSYDFSLSDDRLTQLIRANFARRRSLILRQKTQHAVCRQKIVYDIAVEEEESYNMVSSRNRKSTVPRCEEDNTDDEGCSHVTTVVERRQSARQAAAANGSRNNNSSKNRPDSRLGRSRYR